MNCVSCMSKPIFLYHHIGFEDQFGRFGRLRTCWFDRRKGYTSEGGRQHQQEFDYTRQSHLSPRRNCKFFRPKQNIWTQQVRSKNQNFELKTLLLIHAYHMDICVWSKCQYIVCKYLVIHWKISDVHSISNRIINHIILFFPNNVFLCRHRKIKNRKRLILFHTVIPC